MSWQELNSSIYGAMRGRCHSKKLGLLTTRLSQVPMLTVQQHQLTYVVGASDSVDGMMLFNTHLIVRHATQTSIALTNSNAKTIISYAGNTPTRLAETASYRPVAFDFHIAMQACQLRQLPNA